MTAAAIVAIVLLGTLIAFQILLAFGIPWGAAAWGGQNLGVLPRRYRIASGITAIAVFPLMILYVVESADLAEISWLPGSGSGVMWALFAFFVFGTFMNVVSRSRVERIWAPVNLALAVCCIAIALGA
jgi:hypothetical protein